MGLCKSKRKRPAPAKSIHPGWTDDGGRDREYLARMRGHEYQSADILRCVQSARVRQDLPTLPAAAPWMWKFPSTLRRQLCQAGVHDPRKPLPEGVDAAQVRLWTDVVTKPVAEQLHRERKVDADPEHFWFAAQDLLFG